MPFLRSVPFLILVFCLFIILGLPSPKKQTRATPPAAAPQPASSPEVSKEEEIAQLRRNAENAMAASDAALEKCLNTTPDPRWPQEARQRYASLQLNGLELQKLSAALREATTKFFVPNAKEQDRTEYFRLNRELSRLNAQFQARSNRFKESLQPLINAEIKAEEEKQRRLRETTNLGVTRKAYELIRDGMWPSEVQLVIGYEFPGEEQSSAGSYRTLAWRDGFRSIVVSFRDKQVVAKAQLGL